MDAKEIRTAFMPNNEHSHARDDWFWLAEIAAQLAESNQLARLRLRMKLIDDGEATIQTRRTK